MVKLNDIHLICLAESCRSVTPRTKSDTKNINVGESCSQKNTEILWIRNTMNVWAIYKSFKSFEGPLTRENGLGFKFKFPEGKLGPTVAHICVKLMKSDWFAETLGLFAVWAWRAVLGWRTICRNERRIWYVGYQPLDLGGICQAWDNMGGWNRVQPKRHEVTKHGMRTQ